VIAVLSVLAWAATASAEGAWVLWVQGAIDSRAFDPEPWGSFQSLNDCKRAASESDIKNRSAEVEKLGMHVLSTCLPDTVDPRGPKGK
jgi:hypothetical protein